MSHLVYCKATSKANWAYRPNSNVERLLSKPANFRLGSNSAFEITLIHCKCLALAFLKRPG